MKISQIVLAALFASSADGMKMFRKDPYEECCECTPKQRVVHAGESVNAFDDESLVPKAMDIKAKPGKKKDKKKDTEESVDSKKEKDEKD